MSKLSHSNHFLEDVLHEGNGHLALGGKKISDREPHIPSNTGGRGKLNLSTRGEAACDAFDRDFDAFCDGEDDDDGY